MENCRHSSVAAFGQTAKRSRRERSAQPAAPLWVRPFRHLRQALAATSRHVSACRRAAVRPQWATLRGRMRGFRRIEEAYDRLSAAADQLQRAAVEMRAVLAALALEPDRAGAAPAEILVATRDILRLSARVAKMSLALDAAAEVLRDDRPAIARPRRIPPELYSKYPSDPLARIRQLLLSLRRRRSRCLATEDAPRRVSRGRAPPFDSTCPL